LRIDRRTWRSSIQQQPTPTVAASNATRELPRRQHRSVPQGSGDAARCAPGEPDPKPKPRPSRRPSPAAITGCHGPGMRSPEAVAKPPHVRCAAEAEGIASIAFPRNQRYGHPPFGSTIVIRFPRPDRSACCVIPGQFCMKKFKQQITSLGCEKNTSLTVSRRELIGIEACKPPGSAW